MNIIFRNNRAIFSDLAVEVKSATSVEVTGNIGFYKEAQDFGVAYKKSSASTWSYSSASDKAVDKTISKLTTGTAYDFCLYVKFQGTYQRSEKKSETPVSA